MATPQQQYLKTKIDTASKEQLVLMLMDGLLRFSEQARKAIEEKNLEETHNKLVRCQNIVLELVAGQDRERGGIVAENLGKLYTYSVQCLVQANLQRDVKKIDEVQHIFRELREGWSGAMEQLRESVNVTEEPAAVAEPVAATTITHSENVTVHAQTEPGPKLAKQLPKGLKQMQNAAGTYRPRLSVQG